VKAPGGVVLTIAYDAIEYADDRRRVRARANCPTPPGRFTPGWLLRLCLLQPDRLRFERTATVLASGRPFVYPLELTRSSLASLAAGPHTLAPEIPSRVLEGVRHGRAVILIWLGHDAVPLEFEDATGVWLFDIIQLFISHNQLPGRAVWLASGLVAAIDPFDEWFRARWMYPPEAVQLRSMTVFPTFAQATYRANHGGWEVCHALDAADDSVTVWTEPFDRDRFRARYVDADGLAAEQASGALRERRFLCLNDGQELHRQVVVSYLQEWSHLADSLVSFDAAPADLNDTCALHVPGAAELDERIRRGWLALQLQLPLRLTDAEPYRSTYFTIASDSSFAGYPAVDHQVLGAIMNCQPFIRVGSPDSLRYLRALGFRTFGRVLDESYDKNDTFGGRLLRILDQLDRVAQRGKPGLRALYFDCLPEIRHNHAHLVDGRHQLDAMLRELDARLGTA
jgi:hypothetical protein